MDSAYQQGKTFQSIVVSSKKTQLWSFLSKIYLCYARMNLALMYISVVRDRIVVQLCSIGLSTGTAGFYTRVSDSKGNISHTNCDTPQNHGGWYSCESMPTGNAGIVV